MIKCVKYVICSGTGMIKIRFMIWGKWIKPGLGGGVGGR